MNELSLQFENVSKNFGDAAGNRAVVRDVNFSVRDGEFFAILGPSGCGKTTLLRMISGLEKPTSGTIRINDQVVNDVHPHKRNVHMVFQKYALFPHLNVFENVAFGLRMKRLPKSEIEARVMKMLSMVKLEQYAKRPIQKLSGGEQQRVALVRALVNEPEILLLDEPLGALDQKLREEMQQELATIQKALKTTFIFVTHDQSEALTLADRVAIMNQGRVEQIGTPTEVYEHPASPFVAQFVGAGNMFRGRLSVADNGASKVESEGFGSLSVKITDDAAFKPGVGTPCQLLVRPEKIRIRSTSPDANAAVNSFRGTLLERVYSGPTTQIKLQVNPNLPPLIVLVANQTAHKMPALKTGERYYAVWDASDSILLPESSPK
jgi:spermidine/putrescine transport system ATP-binding protein